MSNLINKFSESVEASGSRFKVKVKCDGGERIKITTIEGSGKSADPVVILPGHKHPLIGYSFDEFRTLGDGTHTIYKSKF